jgi:hypothetical protein
VVAGAFPGGIDEKLVFHGDAVAPAALVDVFELDEPFEVAADLHRAPAGRLPQFPTAEPT